MKHFTCFLCILCSYIPVSSTHHQHIRVNLVHLGQEEAEQSSLCGSYLHPSILTEGGRHSMFSFHKRPRRGAVVQEMLSTSSQKKPVNIEI